MTVSLHGKIILCMYSGHRRGADTVVLTGALFLSCLSEGGAGGQIQGGAE